MITIRTPFRICLGGGGTDLPSYYESYEGYLISAAINKYLYVSINEPSTSDKLKLYYSKVEIIEASDIEDIEHDIIRESLKFFGLKRPLEIASMADIEAGTGMGSSSSFTVALMAGLNLLNHKVISKSCLAEEACHIEIVKVGKKIGKQDQYISAYGGIQEMKIGKKGKVDIEPVILKPEFISELEYRMLLFYTGIKRPAALILDGQSDAIKAKHKSIVSSMHRIKELGTLVKIALINEDIDELGFIFDEHWQEKKSISREMSSNTVNEWYDLALISGAIGGKLIGAGGGGFLLLVCQENRRKELIRTMESAGLRFVDFRFDFEGVKIMST
jgi:D-glycero-alpha-D-manno-heptose-7-phosphate kinase